MTMVIQLVKTCQVLGKLIKLQHNFLQDIIYPVLYCWQSDNGMACR